MNELLIEETRNGLLECEHRGVVCGVDRHSQPGYVLGNIHTPAFLRSTGKPLQIIPVVRSGTLEHYQLKDRDLALMTSSHRGESFHIDAMEHMMQCSGLEEKLSKLLPLLSTKL